MRLTSTTAATRVTGFSTTTSRILSSSDQEILYAERISFRSRPTHHPSRPRKRGTTSINEIGIRQIYELARPMGSEF
jgi:hypothetical protein